MYDAQTGGAARAGVAIARRKGVKAGRRPVGSYAGTWAKRAGSVRHDMQYDTISQYLAVLEDEEADVGPTHQSIGTVCHAPSMCKMLHTS